jgi:hypothetical protein
VAMDLGLRRTYMKEKHFINRVNVLKVSKGSKNYHILG